MLILILQLLITSLRNPCCQIDGFFYLEYFFFSLFIGSGLEPPYDYLADRSSWVRMILNLGQCALAVVDACARVLAGTESDTIRE